MDILKEFNNIDWENDFSTFDYENTIDDYDMMINDYTVNEAYEDEEARGY